VWNDDPSGATHQVRVDWQVECSSVEFHTVGSETVSAPSQSSSATDGTIVQFTLPVDQSQWPSCYAGDFLVAVTATVTDVANGGSFNFIGVDVPVVNVPSAQLTAAACGTDSAAPGQAQAYRGDPVNTATGECAEQQTDAQLQGPGYPLKVTRDYSRAYTAGGPLGPGWTLPWQASLAPQPNGNVIFTSEDGNQYTYSNNYNGTYSSPPGATATLASNSSGYVLTAPDHHVLTFNTSGQLVSMDDATGRGLVLIYSGGQVSTITDAAGRTVSLSYNGPLLTQIALQRLNMTTQADTCRR
jgi:hypothetical protein